MVRILEIVFTNPKYGGGLEKVSITLGNYLNEKGINVSYIFSDIKNYEMFEDKFKFIAIKNNHKYIGKLIFNIKVYNYVKRHKDEYDIYHINGDNGGLITKIHNIKTILTLHGSSKLAMHSIGTINIFKLLYLYVSNRLELFAAKRADVVTLVSPFLKELIIDETKRKDLVVIDNGIDIKKYIPVEKSFAKEKLGLNREQLYGIWVGRDPGRKRLDFSIELIENTKELNLICIGNTNTKLNVSNRIKLLGNVDNNKLIEYYQACDFLLFPSLYEGFSLVIIEAMACGTVPIISKNITIPGLENNVNAFIANNDKDYIKILKNIEKNPSILKNMRNNAISLSHKYSSSISYEKYYTLIMNLYAT